MLHCDRRKLEHGWIVVPFIESATADEARAAVRAAGLTGPISVVVLSEDDAILETPRGRVTGAHPRWDEIVPPGAEISIYVNPGEAQPLTAAEEASRDAFRRRDLIDRDRPAAIFRERLRPTPNFAAHERPVATTKLDADLLAQLERQLRDRGAAVVDALAPGLPDDQIDELLLPIGIDLPDEARCWWHWQNGTRRGANGTLGLRDLLDLDTVCENYERSRGGWVEAFGLDGLLQGLGWTPHLYFDCSGARQDTVPVFGQSDFETPEMIVGSMGDLVNIWLEMLDTGIWRVKHDGQMEVDRDHVPPTLQLLA